MTKKTIAIGIIGMSCAHCQSVITKALQQLNGVTSASVSLSKASAEITYDSELTGFAEFKTAIEDAGYSVRKADSHTISKVLYVFIVLIALHLLIRYTVGFSFINAIPKIDQTMSFAALFAAGLLTSVHCLAMCGGINLSQCVGLQDDDTRASAARPILYNLGRVLSYTLIGGIVGALGSVLFISNTIKGIIMVVAAIFMLAISLMMLGWLPGFLMPGLLRNWLQGSERTKTGRGPFIIGLLNGLMPCGPLQAMQLYALSTGSALLGAFSMFLFSMGTVPLMLGAGLVVSALKGRFTRAITRVSAVLVMLIAVMTLYNASGFFGWSLFKGPPNPSISGQQTGAVQTYRKSGEYTVANLKDGYQEVVVDVQANAYPPIIVQKGTPVKFNLRAAKKDLNGCNEAILIPMFNIRKELQPGDNIVEFTPTKAGTIPFTCWMSMIKSSIVVVDDLSKQ